MWCLVLYSSSHRQAGGSVHVASKTSWNEWEVLLACGYLLCCCSRYRLTDLRLVVYKDRLVDASSDWSCIESPSGQHPDGQQRPEQDDANTSSNRRKGVHKNAILCEQNLLRRSMWSMRRTNRSVTVANCDHTYSSLHVRLTMMPHVINVLHQNCQRHQMTSVRIIKCPAHHLWMHQIFNRAKESSKRYE